MWTEIVITHRASPDELVLGHLARIFGDHDPEALNDSYQFSADKWKNTVLYSRTLASYRVLCLRDGDDQLVVYVECIRGDIFEACQSVWQKARRALTDLKPNLQAADVVEGPGSPRYLRGTCTTLAKELRKRETLIPLLVGLATVVYFLVAIVSFGSSEKAKYAQGAVAGTITAVVVVGLAIYETRKAKIVWTVRGVE